MKNFVTIALVVIMSLSCMKEYDVVTVENQRDFLPKPTRTEVSSGNDSLMVLGPQQTNPYTVSIMQEARRLLLEENPGLEIPELTVSHYYVRFAPRDDEELYSLLQDTTILFYDFPLDREIISGTYYHDPAIVDSLPTYQYASIPAAKWISMRFSLDVELPPYEVLSLLFIPEEVEGFFDIPKAGAGAF